MNTERQDIYTRITDKIIADLAQGIRTWMKPWNAGVIERISWRQSTRATGRHIGTNTPKPVAGRPTLCMIKDVIDDRLFFPQLQPEVAGNPAVVLVDAPVALPPVIEFAGGHTQPRNESPDADLGLLRPAPDEIHHLVPHVMRHPTAG